MHAQYWPMLASGDWEQLQPLFEFYARTLKLAQAVQFIVLAC